jgi:hypothetical protein
MPRLHVSAATSVVLAALVMTVLACGPAVPTPSPTSRPFPSPRAGAPACPTAAGQPSLVARLAAGGIIVTAVSASTGEALFPEALSVCLMDVGTASFEAAFFVGPTAASAVHVCESRSGSRYIYQVDGQTVDAAFPQYWTIAGDVLAWTGSTALDRSLTQALGGIRPRC